MKRLLIFFVILSLASCASKKDVLYLQDIEDTVLEDLDQVFHRSRVAVSDILYVGIAAEDQESIQPFQFQKTEGSSSRSNINTRNLKLEGYLVDIDGNINFPQLGEIQVKGKTIKEVEQDLQRRLGVYIKNPTVVVRLVNNKITVLGEVRSPGTFELDEEAFTLPQLLGRAGDLTIRGKRKNVLIIRNEGDRRIVKRIDLTKSDWMNGPFYYMKQNDIVYVEPNDPQVRAAGHISGLGSAMSVISFILSLGILVFK